MNFATVLKNLRDTQHVTQEELAEYLNVSRPTIAGYETKNRQPDFEKLEKIATFFHVSLDYLLTGSEFEKISINPHRPMSDNLFHHKLLTISKRLSPESKEDALKYLELLQLRDEKQKESNRK